MDSGYRDQAMPEGKRIERLEDAVASFKFRRFYEAARWGFIVLFGGCGLGAALYGGSFLARQSYQGTVREIEAQEVADQAAHIREQERAALIPAEEQSRERARGQCESACQSAGLGIERAWVVADGDHWRAAQCSCVGPHSHRSLWNDLRSRESILQGQCADACREADLGLSRAIVTREGRRELRSVACACVDGQRHRTLWDDRQETQQLCTLVHGTLRCNLDEQPAEIQFSGSR